MEGNWKGRALALPGSSLGASVSDDPGFVASDKIETIICNRFQSRVHLLAFKLLEKCVLVPRARLAFLFFPLMHFVSFSFWPSWTAIDDKFSYGPSPDKLLKCSFSVLSRRS